MQNAGYSYTLLGKRDSSNVTNCPECLPYIWGGAGGGSTETNCCFSLITGSQSI